MQRSDVDVIADVFAQLTKAEIDPILARLKVLEDRAPIPGPAGERGPEGPIVTVTGIDGKDGAVGERGPEGPEGKPGRDGRDGLPGLQGERGLDGKDGLDGFGFDDFEVTHDGERGLTFRFLRGDRVKSFGPFIIPAVLDRGVYRDGASYEKGDGVTWGGSFWIAQETTSAKPGTAEMASRAWRLAVKAGREGKPGPQGPQGERGQRGEKGDRGPDRW